MSPMTKPKDRQFSVPGMDEIVRRPKTPSPRPLRVGEEIRKALSVALAQDSGHAIPEVVSENLVICRVALAPDLKSGTVSISMVQSHGYDIMQVCDLLQSLNPLWAKILFKKLRLRVWPRLRFVPKSL